MKDGNIRGLVLGKFYALRQMQDFVQLRQRILIPPRGGSNLPSQLFSRPYKQTKIVLAGVLIRSTAAQNEHLGERGASRRMGRWRDWKRTGKYLNRDGPRTQE
jgi:hypothetical protein